MKSVEINDLLSYHFYGNLKVKDEVKVFVDGVVAEKENAYEYTLKCVKDDKVYDLTSFSATTLLTKTFTSSFTFKFP